MSAEFRYRFDVRGRYHDTKLNDSYNTS